MAVGVPIRASRQAVDLSLCQPVERIDGLGSFMAGQVIADVKWQAGEPLRVPGFQWTLGRWQRSGTLSQQFGHRVLDATDAFAYYAQADELVASLTALTSMWSGSASDKAVASTMPMVVWLRTVSAQAMKRALHRFVAEPEDGALVAMEVVLVRVVDDPNGVTIHGIMQVEAVMEAA